MNALELTNITKSFGATGVLSGVDLSVPEGSFTAVLGASGSGKTTLLRIVAGFESANAGVVTLLGRTIDGPSVHVAPERRGLGYVPQEGSLFPHLNVAQNVGFALRRGTRRQRVSELLDLVGLADLRARYPHELSGGQQQRIALARALAIAPPVILLDEPFAALDAAMRSSVRADIGRILQEAGTTVVLVTHDQDEALSMADQVAVLRDGRMVQIGSPEELYDKPVDPILAAFLGEANLVDGKVKEARAETALGAFEIRDASASGDVVVLIRPEQISLVMGSQSDGVTGRVIECAYHGHDSLVRVQPDSRFKTGAIVVRVQSSHPYQLGAEVTLRARGPISCWPNPGTIPA